MKILALVFAAFMPFLRSAAPAPSPFRVTIVYTELRGCDDGVAWRCRRAERGVRLVVPSDGTGLVLEDSQLEGAGLIDGISLVDVASAPARDGVPQIIVSARERAVHDPAGGRVVTDRVQRLLLLAIPGPSTACCSLVNAARVRSSRSFG